MKKIIILILSAYVLHSGTSTQAQTAMFGINPQHAGVYNSNFPSNMILAKKWSFKTNDKIFSSAVVANDLIYFGSDDSCLYAIDSLGIQKWKFKSNGKIRSTPAVKDSVVYFNNYGARFYAINNKTGLELWHFDALEEAQFDDWDFYQSSPVFSDTIIYFGSGKNMYAINMNNGNKLWNYTTTGLIHSTPALLNGKLFFGCWNSKLYALDAFEGTKLWEFTAYDGIPSSPTIIDSFVFIGSRDANVYAINANTGKKIWSAYFGGSWMPSSFAIYNDTLYTGSSDAHQVAAINKTNGNRLYSILLPCYAFSTPAFSNGKIFIGCMNGSLFYMDTKDHKIISCFDTDGHTKDINNALNDNGTLNLSVVKDPNFVSMMLTSGTIASTPVINKNVIYFGSADSCFYAVNDNGLCVPNNNVNCSKINLGNISTSTIDTAFYVINNSDCIDSLKTFVSTPVTLAKAIKINPTIYNIAPHDSMLVHLSLDTNSLKTNYNYKINFVTQSKTNEYNIFNTELSFIINSITNINQIGDSKSNLIYPNPFKKLVQINYKLEQNCLVDIRIYNSTGQLMRIITREIQTIGEHQVTWDGYSDNGIKINSGFYICSITKGNSSINKKILFIK